MDFFFVYIEIYQETSREWERERKREGLRPPLEIMVGLCVCCLSSWNTLQTLSSWPCHQ